MEWHGKDQRNFLVLHQCNIHTFSLAIFSLSTRYKTATMAQSLASHAVGWVFESQARQTKVVNTGDSSTAKRSATGVSGTDPRKWPL